MVISPRFFFRSKKYKEAFETQQEYVKVHPENYGAMLILARYALFAEQPEAAIEAAFKTKELYPRPYLLSEEVPLAIAYLLKNQWSKAEHIFASYKGLRLPKGGRDNSDKLFLKFITNLEEAGITHPDFDKAKKFFEE